MPIRASSSRQIETLVADLTAPSAITRETALARLTVIGARAVERLVALAQSSGDAASRAAAFRALEAIADPRSLEPALQAVDDADATVATDAIGAARGFVLGPHGARAVDRLTATALDRSRPEPVRVAALRALGVLEPATIAPLLKSLANDPAAAVRAEAAADRPPRGAAAIAPADTLAAAAEHGLPDDVRALHQAIVRGGGDVTLAALLRIIERVREREGSEPAGRKAEWGAARAAAHVALANRGSRIALYDLRESLEGARQPLPVEVLAALSLVGDASCLEAIASAFTRSRDVWWRQHLAQVFRTIVKRERLTRRHAAVKRVEQRWPQALDELWSEKAGKAGGAGKAGR